MGFFDRLTNGWHIAMSSLKVLQANKQLIILPILSGISMVLVTASFISVYVGANSWSFDGLQDMNRATMYALLFLFYVVNYFVVVFFNMALVHCAKLYFDGEEVTVSKGLQFSISRIGAIFAWAVLSATVGVILKMIQDRAGWLGKIATSLVGMVWSIATFFVVPVIAYEKLSPVEAVKRSAELMKEKWGEGLGATFSFGLIQFGFLVVFGIAALAVSALINEAAGIVLFVLGVLFTFSITSALNNIFISAVYNNINGKSTPYFHEPLLDGLFEEK